MDSLDSVFVPYRDMFSPKVSSPKASRWRWLWLGMLAILGVAAAIMLFRGKSTSNLWMPTSISQKAAAIAPTSFASPSASVPSSLSVAPAIKIPPLSAIPHQISLIRGGGSVAAASSPTELAKQVGLAVKQTLLTFPTLSPEIVASIVQHTVRTVLGTPTVKPPTADASPKASPKPVSAIVSPQKPILKQPVAAPPTGGRVFLEGQAIPMVHEDDIAPQEGGAKQKKINADNDPSILKLMKERGLDVKQ